MDVELREAASDDLPAVRRLIEEYVRGLGVDLSFQEIDTELADLGAMYGPPRGRILLAHVSGEAAGCVALRALEPPEPAR